MAKTPKQLDEFLKPMRDEDASTLRALDQKLHLLLDKKRKDERATNGDLAVPEEIAAQCPGVRIAPDLIALVGIHPETPIESDKILIRESIARRLND